MEQPDPVLVPRGRGSMLYLMATVAALYLAREVLVPVAMAILLTFIASPMVSWIERRIRSRVAAVAITTLLVTAIAGGGLMFVGTQFARLAERLPEYRETVVRKARVLGAGPTGLLGRVSSEMAKIGRDVSRPEPDPEAPPTSEPPTASPQKSPADDTGAPSPDSASVLSFVTPIVNPLASSAMVILLLVMMLMSRESIRNRVIRLAGLDHVGPTTHALDEAAVRIGRYLRSQLLINTIYGAAIGGGLLAIGIPNALLCGIMAGGLRFIPVVGPWLGAVIPITLSLAVFDGWSHVGLVLALFAGCEVVASVVLEPWLYGSSTGLSGFGLVLAVIFWTWIWGPVGLVLAVPITVCVVVFGRYVPALTFLWVLLANDPVLSPAVRYYQRLLSHDEEEAAAILATTSPGVDPAAVLDEVVIPSLGAARRDQVRSLISAEQARDVASTASQVAADWLAELPPPEPAPTPLATRPQVVCLPAGDPFDSAAVALFVELLQREGVAATAVSTNLLFSERIAAALTPEVRVAVVVSVEHMGELHTRRTCRALRRGRTDGGPAVIAWGGPPPNAEKALEGREEPGLVRAVTIRQAVALVKSQLAVQPTPSAPHLAEPDVGVHSGGLTPQR